MPSAPAVRIFVICLLLLLTFAGPAASVTSVAMPSGDPGFWEGLVDGFLSLPKLSLSFFLDVVLVDPGSRLLSYDIGFYLGALLFAGGGAAWAE